MANFNDIMANFQKCLDICPNPVMRINRGSIIYVILKNDSMDVCVDVAFDSIARTFDLKVTQLIPLYKQVAHKFYAVSPNQTFKIREILESKFFEE